MKLKLSEAPMPVNMRLAIYFNASNRGVGGRSKNLTQPRYSDTVAKNSGLFSAIPVTRRGPWEITRWSAQNADMGMMQPPLNVKTAVSLYPWFLAAPAETEKKRSALKPPNGKMPLKTG
jgi:hypothetical protein